MNSEVKPFNFNVIVEAKVIRANGKVEDYGEIVNTCKKKSILSTLKRRLMNYGRYRSSSK